MNTVNFGSVPIDDLAPREATPYAPPFGKGRYSVELSGTFETLTGKNSWEAVKVAFINGESLNNAAEPKEDAVIDTSFTTAHNNPDEPQKTEQALSIGAQQLTSLAYALGIAQVENGSANFSVEDADDAIAQLQAGVGGRVGITVTHKVRKADNGNTYTDMNISQIFRLEDLS